MSDALDRLRNRKRPTVSPRDTSLSPIDPTEREEESSTPDVQTSRYLDIETTRSKKARKIKQESEAQESEAVGKPEEAPIPIAVKQTTLRFEQTIAAELQKLCGDEQISREVLLEAMFLHCQAEPEILRSILATAQERHQLRVQAANQKRAYSMMQKFGKG